MRQALAPIIAAMMALASPALAVGLGPLTKRGVTDGPDKAFYLTVYNPYAERADFTVYAVGSDNEETPVRVRVPARAIPLKPGGARKFTIVAGELAPGETYAFRICAERLLPQEAMIHARVCSRITAHRLPAGADRVS
jgi:hypothetical protein